MSHAASIAAVFFLNASIALDIIALVSPWWDLSHIAVHGTTKEVAKCEVKLTLWDIEMKSNIPVPITVLGVTKVDGDGHKISQSWGNFCGRATLDGGETGWCHMIIAMRALIIIAAIFSFFGGLGVAMGNYYGNTIIDAGSGFVGNIGNFSGLLAIIIAVSMDIDTLYLAALKEAWGEDRTFGTPERDTGPGRDGMTLAFGMLIGACVAQFLGGVCACVGTCQEMKEVAKLAMQQQKKEDEKKGPHLTRGERAKLEHDKDDQENAQRYANLKKRQEAGDPTLQVPDETAKTKDAPIGGADEERPRKNRVMLKRVLFRSEDQEDEEIPTNELIAAFNECDGDGSGEIEMVELVEALHDCDVPISDFSANLIMKEIDKDCSGFIDMREFIKFFRQAEDYKKFDQKNKARQQFASFLANFCFLADTVVVGVMLMIFINMNEEEDPDSYAITKNVMIACIVLLCVLFLVVIMFPVIGLCFGPSYNRMSAQYALAQEMRKAQRKSDLDEEEAGNSQPARYQYTAADPPPPVNGAQFGRSYRPQMVTQNAWTQQQLTLMPPSQPQRPPTKSSIHSQAPLAIQDSDEVSPNDTGGSASQPPAAQSQVRAVRQYNPDFYVQARANAESVIQENQGPMSWTPMQIRGPGQRSQAEMMQTSPNALLNASMPTNMIN